MNVYTARWILPIAAPAIPNGAVGVDLDGRIAYIGPIATAPAGARHALGDAVLLPGLVAVDPPRDSDARDDRGLETAVAAGVTTLATTIGAGEFDAVLQARIPGVAYVGLAGTFGALRSAVAELRARLVDAGGDDRTRIGVALGAAHEVEEDLLLDLCAWAVGEGLPIALTVGASPDEVAYLREASGSYADARRAAGFDVVRRAHSAVHLLAELGVAAVARPLLVGGAYWDATDVALAAYYDCPVAYAPAAAAGAASAVAAVDPAPVATLVAAGVRVALATRDPLGLAARLAVDPTAAVRLATLEGARALDVDHDVGSLEVGKLADLSAFALAPDDCRTADVLGPERALLARPRASTVLRLVGGHPARVRGV